MKNRAGRIIVAIVFLIFFGIYTYKQEQIHTHSDDLAYMGEATGMHPQGFHADTVIDYSEQTPAAEQTPEADPAAAAPTDEPAPEVTPEPTEEPVRFDMTSWEFTLVNGDHSIDKYEPEQLAYLNQTLDETDIQLTYNPNRCPVDARIADQLIQFGLACKEAGYPVFLSSGYRSYSEQADNFRRICENNGVSDGKNAEGHYITMPAGCSEHQLALCCDITDIYRSPKNEEIEKTDTYKWLCEHCWEYGFVVRFPNDKKDITGVMYEPWHFRYVGVEAARYMTENNLTLEEMWEIFG